MQVAVDYIDLINLTRMVRRLLESVNVLPSASWQSITEIMRMKTNRSRGFQENATTHPGQSAVLLC